MNRGISDSIVVGSGAAGISAACAAAALRQHVIVFDASEPWPYPSADLGMAVGIVTDELARVFDHDHQPIDGLYACGNDMHSIVNGAYPGPGTTIGPALVFGYIAARHASHHVSSTP